MGAWFHSEVNDVHALSALIGGFILIFGFVSLIVKERLYLSESLVATLIGIIIGPVCAGLLDPAKWPMETHKVTLAFTEIVIAIQVMAASIALPRSLWKDQRGSLAMLYGPVMMWMWLVSALLIWLILPVPWTQCLILAAALAPTDPVLANSLMTGRFADKYISVPIRHLLSGESAANDGLAVPMFQLGIYLTSYPTKEAWGTWAYHVVLYEIGVGIVFGALVGYVAKCMLRASEKRNYIDKRSFLSVEVALALFVLGFASMLQLASFLSVFATGLIFAWDGWFTEETEEAHVQEVIDNLVNMTFFIYFGAIIPWSTFNQYYALPKLVLLSVLLLILRRLPPVLALHHYLPVLTRRPALLTRREALLVGYFGPVGVGALWYVNYAYDKGAIGEEGMTIVSWVVWCAVVVYGITAVLMHGLVRTLSVVRVYSGRSLNGRTLSLPSAIRGAPMWPSNIPVTAVQISGPIMSQHDIQDIQSGGGRAGTSFEIRPVVDLDDSSGTVTDGGPVGILVKPDTNTNNPNNSNKPNNPNDSANTLADKNSDMGVAFGRSTTEASQPFHETIYIDQLRPASPGTPGPETPTQLEGELGIPPGSVTEVHAQNAEDVLVGVGVRFRTFDTR